MTLHEFDLQRAATVAEASGLRAKAGEDASFYCGGTELIQAMRMGLADYRLLIDLKGIPELRGIERGDGRLRIGAAVTHRELEMSAAVREDAPGLAELELHIGNLRVRSTGTIGGNLCFAEPHSDPATFLLAWGAEVELASSSDRRRVPIDRFIRGAFQTDRAPDEILVAIHLLTLPPRTAVVHRKIAFLERPAATVACRVGIVEDRLSGCKIAVGSVGEAPMLVAGAAAALDGVPVSELDGRIDEIAALAAAGSEVVADLNGDIDYKRALVRVLARDAMRAAFAVVRAG